MKAVKIHCGSAHVKGKARRYPYLVAILKELTPFYLVQHYKSDLEKLISSM